MNYLKNINDFDSDIELNEKLNIAKYRNVFQKIVKDLHINFYFIATFGTIIPVFYPIFTNLVKNQKLEINLSSSDIVLLTIYAIAVLLNENKQEIEKIKNILIEKGAQELMEKSVLFIKSINKIFSAISKNTGKLINNFLDMLSYVALYVPFLIGLLDLINLYDINFDTFNDTNTTTMGVGFSLGIGIISISFKHFINILVKKINRLTKNKQIIESILVNDIFSEYKL